MSRVQYSKYKAELYRTYLYVVQLLAGGAELICCGVYMSRVHYTEYIILSRII
jgi:hypothetical protein